MVVTDQMNGDTPLKLMTTLTDNPWIVCPKPNPRAALRLFCFPYAGGGTSVFRLWPDELPPDIEVCAVQLPGRETQLAEPPITDIGRMVQAVIRGLAPAFDAPFALFGHSMGALIAFEVARQLRAQFGLAPVHLFISGRRAPHLPDNDVPISHLPEPAFVEQFSQRYENSIPRLILEEAELREIFLPILRADITLLETYVYAPQAPLDCPISVFGGTEDKRATPDQLLAWQDQTRGSFTLELLPGGHFFLHSARGPLLGSIAQKLAESRGRR